MTLNDGLTIFGVLLMNLRLISVVVFGFYADLEVDAYNKIHDSAAILLAPPLSGQVLVGHQIGIAGAIFGLISSLVWGMTVINNRIQPVFFLGTLDCILTALLAAAVGLQASSIGVPTFSTCNQLDANRPRINLTIDSASKQLVLFERIGSLNTSDPSFAHDNCYDYLAQWGIALSMLILSAVCLLFSHCGNFPSWFPASLSPPLWRHGTRWQTISSIKDQIFYLVYFLLYTAIMHVVFALLIVVATPFFILFFLWALLPRFVQQPLYFYRRCIQKRCYAMFHQSQPIRHPTYVHLKSLLKISQKRKQPVLNGDISLGRRRKTEPLAYLLAHYPILQAIVGNLHHIDVLNLSQASKNIESVLCPVNAQEAEKTDIGNALKIYSCDKKSRTSCWACSMQVCEGCSLKRRLADSYIVSHRHYCVAHCTKCYHRNALRLKNLNSTSRSSLYCICSGARRTKQSKSIGKPSTAFLNTQRRSLCRECSSMDDIQLLKLRDRRDTLEHTRPWCQPETCANCGSAFPNRSMVWWACSFCAKECASMDAHLHWVAKATPPKTEA